MDATLSAEVPVAPATAEGSGAQNYTKVLEVTKAAVVMAVGANTGVEGSTLPDVVAAIGQADAQTQRPWQSLLSGVLLRVHACARYFWRKHKPTTFGKSVPTSSASLPATRS